MKVDGSDEQKLSDYRVGYMQVYGNRIFFTEHNGVDFILHSMKTDGTDKQKLSDDATYEIYVAGGRIYYLNGSDDNKLYSINIDGSGRQKLTDFTYAFYMSVLGDRIYFMGKEDEGFDYKALRLYSMNLDGSDVRLVD